MRIKNKKSKSFKLILVFIITIVVVAIFKLWPETKGEEIVPTSVTIEFSSGEKEDVFDSVTKTITTNKTSGYITLPTEFASTVSVSDTSYFKKVDSETFYFTEGDYSYTFTGWKIKDETKITPNETVFQPGDKIDAKTLMTFDKNEDGIVELEALWGKVIYAENAYEDVYYTDYWMLDLETTKTHNKTGAWNYKINEDNTVTLNDGKDVENPVCTMDYAYYLIYQMDYKNGFSNAKSYNAYEYVIMLVGDLDYVKTSSNGTTQEHYFTSYDIYNGTYDESKNYIFGEYPAQQGSWGYVSFFQSDGGLRTSSNANNAREYAPSVSFKSCTKDTTENYNLYLNGYGYYDTTYSSIRIDNVNYVKSPDTKRPNKSDPVSTASETAFYGRKDCFVEFTRRATTSNFVFRPNAVETVVVNGSNFASWQTSWSSNQTTSTYNYDLHWYMGENAKVSGDINLGTTANYVSTEVTVNQNFYFTMTGGTANNIYATSNGMNSTSSGIRKITIVGDKGTSTKTNPKVNNVYGGGNTGPYTGNTDITIKGVTNIGNVYGGGFAFTATTYGNTNVNISDSSISGNVFGGGYNGNVEKDSSGNGGNVNLNIENSKVGGNIFGSGMGGTQSLNLTLSLSATQKNTNWQNVTYVPSDSFFTNVKDEINGDYNTDWSWDKPATGFPFIQEETDYICTAIYKNLSWVSNNESNLTFQRTYVYSYLSVAIVENDVNITIDGSTIGKEGDSTKGNVYGGGSVAVVGGNTYVTIKGNSIIYGNVYGGGDGATKPAGVSVYYPATGDYTGPTYTVNRDSSGSIISVSTSSESSKYKNFKYDGTFSWSNEEYLIEQGGIDAEKKLIYSPNVGQLGIVNGNTNVIIENSEVKENIYAGGNAADVLGDTNITFTNSTAKDIFGGGYSGGVNKNTNITINSGNLENVFGGGDLGVVNGNTQVTIGNSSNPNINISSLLYGGGRGVDSDGDGDASDFTTVDGAATVIIEGINTFVENYGSSTIGAVQGEINVTFRNYWTGNATNQYKTMNGIDRATNVYFENSYVLLTNRDEEGNLIGIKSIENLYIPDGSGLKISAPGEISGNFEGGGNLYLDSEVCLTVRGNITGSTTLVLNPLMYSESYVIKGGFDNPYMQVYGEIPEDSLQVSIGDAQALVSGDNRYKILFEKVDDYTKYYISEDVVISQTISETVLLKNGRQYDTNIEQWQTGNINMLQDDSISCNVKVSYQYNRVEVENEGKYKNIERSIIIRSGEEVINIPKNTKITMIVDDNGENTYYKYKTDSELSEVKLSDFTQMEDNSKKYIETKDITAKATGDSLTNIYTYNEQFQFILDFSECENYLEANKTYNILLDEVDNNTQIDELTFDATNTMNLHSIRNINYDAQINQNKILNTGNITITGNMLSDAISDSTIIYNDEGKELSIKIALKNANGNYISIPEGTVIRINGIENETKQDIFSYNILEIAREEINEQLNIEFDMSKTNKNGRLGAGTYKLEVAMYISNNDVAERKLGSKDFEFGITEGEGYGLVSEFVSDSENKDKLQLFGSAEKTLQINVNKGNLDDANLKIDLQKRISPFTYSSIENTITDKEIKSEDLKEVNNIKVKNGLEAGTYRIVISLYDGSGIKYTEERINFMVK